MRQRDIKAFGFLFIVFLIIGGISTFFKTFGFVIPAVIVGGIVFLYIWINSEAKKVRRKELLEKYRDVEIVERLMTKTIWQGQTSEQVIDSWGEPSALDTKILKTKQKEVWKYNPTGSNRYTSRVFLENDIVVGWEQKT